MQCSMYNNNNVDRESRRQVQSAAGCGCGSAHLQSPNLCSLFQQARAPEAVLVPSVSQSNQSVSQSVRQLAERSITEYLYLGTARAIPINNIIIVPFRPPSALMHVRIGNEKKWVWERATVLQGSCATHSLGVAPLAEAASGCVAQPLEEP